MTKKPKKGEPGLDYYYVLPEVDNESKVTNSIDNIRKELFGEKYFKDMVPVCTQITILHPDSYIFHKQLGDGH